MPERPSRYLIIDMIMEALLEDSATRSPGECVHDKIGHLLVRDHDPRVVVQAVDDLQEIDEGVDADIEVYAELQKLGVVPVGT